MLPSPDVWNPDYDQDGSGERQCRWLSSAALVSGTYDCSNYRAHSRKLCWCGDDMPAPPAPPVEIFASLLNCDPHLPNITLCDETEEQVCDTMAIDSAVAREKCQAANISASFVKDCIYDYCASGVSSGKGIELCARAVHHTTHRWASASLVLPFLTDARHSWQGEEDFVNVTKEAEDVD